MTSSERLRAAFTTVTAWMRENDAEPLADNLADGASDRELDEAERELGFPLPTELRDLWKLHHGQREELNGFVESRDLLDVHRAIGERDTVQLSLEFLRETPDTWEEAQVQPDEAQSDQWVPFAGRDSDLLVVCTVSGRVFTCEKDAPPFHLIASSIVEWAEQYAARVAADDYAVEEGFGDCYLELRDRKKEAREAEQARKQAEEERYRRETPALKQVEDGVAAGDGDALRELFERLATEGPPETLSQAVTLLFARATDPRLIATAFQFVLRKVTLSPEQWATVAEGGEALGNNAIRDLSLARAAADKKKPWWRFF